MMLRANRKQSAEGERVCRIMKRRGRSKVSQQEGDHVSSSRTVSDNLSLHSILREWRQLKIAQLQASKQATVGVSTAKGGETAEVSSILSKQRLESPQHREGRL